MGWSHISFIRCCSGCLFFGEQISHVGLSTSCQSQGKSRPFKKTGIRRPPITDHRPPVLPCVVGTMHGCDFQTLVGIGQNDDVEGTPSRVDPNQNMPLVAGEISQDGDYHFVRLVHAGSKYVTGPGIQSRRAEARVNSRSRVSGVPDRNDPDQGAKCAHEEGILRVDVTVVSQNSRLNGTYRLRDGGLDIMPGRASWSRNSGYVTTGEVVKLAVTEPEADAAWILAGIIFPGNLFKRGKMLPGVGAYPSPYLSVRNDVTNLEIGIILRALQQDDLVIASWLEPLDDQAASAAVPPISRIRMPATTPF